MPRKPQDHNPDGLESDVPQESQGGRKATPYSRSWHIAKAAIRGCDIAFSIIVIVITLHMLVTIGYSSPYLLLFSAIPGVVAIFWDVSELITICARGGRKGIHPGAHVGLHLIFWLVFAIAVVCESLFRSYSFDWPFATYEHVALAFTCLLLLNHFILFVRACIETSQRNTGAPIYTIPTSMTAPQQQCDTRHEKGQMIGANVPTETTAPSGSDGTYYGPGGQA
ncbi:hypothetical protein LY78DRAFT_704382 [Colletotrichum sublineola]|uniref:MARVEL domain-containing protein n=1 Tax=Colletotrichum sublineola TaxID=1173701 RepID=A0A066XCZ5_COLSU|nr:hypothetical protein LY78DRAFT_704382 [Colletotrichum sublineola]KDN66792.1 hypothetical protein CSUB01_02975 [Colletotrichum sublineola]